MTQTFKIQRLQSIPGVFTQALSAGIFKAAPKATKPFFKSSDYSELVTQFPHGIPEIVITGQQPGFMGGPLYTLYKIATTISLAQLRSAKGLPTVPVFWAGDDDDDLAEAMVPKGWDPLLGQFFSGRVPPGDNGLRVLSKIPAGDFSQTARAWLKAAANLTTSDNAVAELGSLYDQAEVEGWSVSKLFCACVAHIFSGKGLIIVQGNDPRLHNLAQPFYERVLPRLNLLQELAAAHPSTAINKRSINNPLFKFINGRRLRLDNIPQMWEPSLRPGVLLRSLVQDWIFDPVAVVVGPGEKAYLEQLSPLYKEMGIHRSPLVPRLFAWLTPETLSAGNLREVLAVEQHSVEKSVRWASEMQRDIEFKMQNILQQEAKLPPEMARSIAENKSRRMTRNMPDFFNTINHGARAQQLATIPPWVMPDGHRQERRLATFNAFAFWGTDLVGTVMKAAGKHLQLGLTNQWQEMMITVPSPDNLLRKNINNE